MATVQKNRLFEIINNNKDTLFAKQYGFDTIESILEYQKRVPIAKYQDFESYIEKMADGKTSILTKESVKLFELSSGTVSGKKLIPYTDNLQEEFQRGINIWICTIQNFFLERCIGPSLLLQN